jgi:hypothetical protein
VIFHGFSSRSPFYTKKRRQDFILPAAGSLPDYFRFPCLEYFLRKGEIGGGKSHKRYGGKE